MTINEFQELIKRIYFERDSARGAGLTFTWFVEEVGELARGILNSDKENLKEEFADVFAWLATLATISGIELEEVVMKKYQNGCPCCGSIPCSCPKA